MRSQNGNESSYCNYCGAKTVKIVSINPEPSNIDKSNDYLITQEQPEPEENNKTKADNLSREQVTIVELIGNNAEYYLNEFEKLKEGSVSKFNWAVFLGGPIVPLYRKCFDFFKKTYLPYLIACFLLDCIQFFDPGLAMNNPFYNIITYCVEICAVIIYILGAKRFNSYYYDALVETLYDSSSAEEKRAKHGTTSKYVVIYIAAVTVIIIILTVNAFFYLIS